jgi:hypothetical protein
MYDRRERSAVVSDDLGQYSLVRHRSTVVRALSHVCGWQFLEPLAIKGAPGRNPHVPPDVMGARRSGSDPCPSSLRLVGSAALAQPIDASGRVPGA